MSYLHLEPNGKFGRLELSSQPSPFPLTSLSSLFSELKSKIYLLTPNNIQSSNNWLELKKGIPNLEEHALDLISSQIQEISSSDLLSWIGLFENLNFKKTVNELNLLFYSQQLKIQVETVSNEEEIEAQILDKLNQEKSGNSSTLTSINLKDHSCASIVTNLGVSYDLYKMIESQDLRESKKKYDLHLGLLTELQRLGLAKIGLPGQDYLEAKNKSLWSKNAIAKVLNSNSFNFEIPDEIRKLPDKQQKLKLASWIFDHLLIKSEFITISASISKLSNLEESSPYKLDEWQRRMINAITEGRSVLVTGPTSAGKTFTSMTALDWIINSKEEIIAYVAPTFHLALQVYSNISKTFPSKKISLITGSINSILNGSQLYIGTPSELYVYLRTVKKKFSIGIFDEIHTLSLSYGSDSCRSEAIGHLLSYCTNQVIGLSATLHSEDIPLLQEYIIKKTGIKEIETIQYFERTIPLKKNECPDAHLTPEATFSLLKTLDKEKKTPLIIFDSSDKEVYSNYLKLIEYLEQVEGQEFPRWNYLYRSLSNKIEQFNEEAYSVESAFLEAMGSPDKLKEISSSARNIAGKRVALLNTLQSHLGSEIRKNLRAQLENPDERQFLTEVPSKIKKIYSRYAQYDPETSSSAPNLPDEVWAETLNLLQELSVLVSDEEQAWDGSSLLPEHLGPVPVICSKVPSYLSLGNSSSSTLISDMLNPGSSNIKWKLHKVLISLCEAERISIEDVKPLLLLISRGLRYSIGIIMKEIPFIAQYVMLNLLSQKKIPVLFASSSMSMGINYPLRSVIIRSNEVKEFNVCELMQMEGRCGRRRLDTEAHVYYWNILNSKNVDLEHLPRIVFPSDEARGTLLQEHKSIGFKIELSRLTLNDTSSLVTAIENLKTEIANKGLVRETIQIDGEEEVKKKSDEKKEKKTTEVNETFLNSSVTSCLAPICRELEMDLFTEGEILERVSKISMGQILKSHREEAYHWAYQISLVKRAIQELHTVLHRSSANELLDFLVSVFELLHRVVYKQLRL